MHKIYVAGCYSAPTVLEVFENMRKGLKVSTELFCTGRYAVFVPWLDYQFCLMKPEGATITIDHFYKYSLAWLEVSDAVLVLPGWENSKGTVAELMRAKELKIPVVYSVKELDELFSGQQFIDLNLGSVEPINTSINLRSI